jgi:hypothetical protein
MKLICLAQFAALALLAQEPRLSSIFPLTVERGQATVAVIRGLSLDGARALYFREGGIEAKVSKVEPAPEPVIPGAKGPPPQLLRVELTTAADAKPGPRKLVAVTGQGLSNELTVEVADLPVSNEPTAPLAVPAIVTGRISRSGEVDEYWIEGRAGQVVNLKASSGSATLDPTVGIYEPSGSWFDAKRLNRLAFNDEPLNFPGLSRDAVLSYTLPHGGRFCIRVTRRCI